MPDMLVCCPRQGAAMAAFRRPLASSSSGKRLGKVILQNGKFRGFLLGEIGPNGRRELRDGVPDAVWPCFWDDGGKHFVGDGRMVPTAGFFAARSSKGASTPRQGHPWPCRRQCSPGRYAFVRDMINSREMMIEKTRKPKGLPVNPPLTAIAYRDHVRPGCGKTAGQTTGNAPLVCGREPRQKGTGCPPVKTMEAFQKPRVLSVSASGGQEDGRELSGPLHLTHFFSRRLAGGGLFLLAHDARPFSKCGRFFVSDKMPAFSHLLLECAQSEISRVVSRLRSERPPGSGHHPLFAEILSKEGADKKHPALKTERGR